MSGTALIVIFLLWCAAGDADDRARRAEDECAAERRKRCDRETPVGIDKYFG